MHRDCMNNEKKGKKRTLQVKVKAGTMNGEIIAMKDRQFSLAIKVKIKDDDKFRLKGQDIFSQILLTAAQAESGKEVEIATIYGMRSISIEPGTKEGTEYIIKGAGFPQKFPNQHLRGNHHVIVLVYTPQDTASNENDPKHQQLIKNINSRFNTLVSEKDALPLFS